jgi:uncharacterized protein HemX
MAVTAAVVGAVAAVGGATYAGHQGQMQKKEINRQKSIAAEQMRVQGEEVAKEKALVDAEEKALQDEIIRKQRGQEALNNAISDKTNKRRMRGRRSLISGSETGINDPFSDTLG